MWTGGIDWRRAKAFASVNTPVTAAPHGCNRRKTGYKPGKEAETKHDGLPRHQASSFRELHYRSSASSVKRLPPPALPAASACGCASASPYPEDFSAHQLASAATSGAEPAGSAPGASTTFCDMQLQAPTPAEQTCSQYG